jgi:4-hydroxy-3-methylbut-2-enyl diphosphate reductase
LGQIKSLGITAGASAPEVLVDEVIDAFRARFEVEVKTVVMRQENVSFKLPKGLRA